jgi:hypothetical protein
MWKEGLRPIAERLFRFRISLATGRYSAAMYSTVKALNEVHALDDRA